MKGISINVHEVVKIERSKIRTFADNGPGSFFVRDLIITDKDGAQVKITLFVDDRKYLLIR